MKYIILIQDKSSSDYLICDSDEHLSSTLETIMSTANLKIKVVEVATVFEVEEQEVKVKKYKLKK